MTKNPDSFALVLGILELVGKKLQLPTVVRIRRVAGNHEHRPTRSETTYMKLKKLALYQKSVLSVMILNLGYFG